MLTSSRAAKPATRLTFALVLALSVFSLSLNRAVAQTKQPAPPSPPKISQKTSRHESQRLGFGSTVSIVGAPDGAITIEGWSRSEVDVSAEIELNADTEEDLKLLATVNTFVFDQDVNHVRIVTTGSHDKAFMKRAAKNFPKRLLGLPWKINFRVRVPQTTDLEIDAGRGPIKVSGVEGALRLSAAESETKLVLTGGVVNATIGIGKVDVSIPVRSWRGGGGADIRVVTGSITVELQPGFSGDIDAAILRTGAIEDSFGGLEAREKPGITPRQVKARAGVGGAYLNLTIGDGMMYLKKATADNK